MKTICLIAFYVLSSVVWLGVDALEVEDFTDGAMSATIDNYDGNPY